MLCDREGSFMSLFRNLVRLTLAMLATLGATAWFAGSRHGTPGVVAASVAAGTCWLGATLAFVLLDRSRRSGAVINGVLMGMLVRLGVPLVVGVVLDGQRGELSDAGVFGLIVVSYLVALAVETTLSVRILQQPRQADPSV
jgi:hypothetical protein